MLNKHEELLQQAEEEGIDVVTCDLPDPLDSAYIRAEGEEETPVIALREGLSTPEAAASCAHALGHHFTGGGNLLAVCPREAERQQVRSGRWAHRRLLPLDALAEACLSADHNPYALCDLLDIPLSFLDAAIASYRDIYGVSVDTDHFRLRFYPSFSVSRL